MRKQTEEEILVNADDGMIIISSLFLTDAGWRLEYTPQYFGGVCNAGKYSRSAEQ